MKSPKADAMKWSLISGHLVVLPFVALITMVALLFRPHELLTSGFWFQLAPLYLMAYAIAGFSYVASLPLVKD